MLQLLLEWDRLLAREGRHVLPQIGGETPYRRRRLGRVAIAELANAGQDVVEEMRLYLTQHDVRPGFRELALPLLEQRLAFRLNVQEDEEDRKGDESVHQGNAVIQDLDDLGDDGQRDIASKADQFLGPQVRPVTDDYCRIAQVEEHRDHLRRQEEFAPHVPVVGVHREVHPIEQRYHAAQEIDREQHEGELEVIMRHRAALRDERDDIAREEEEQWHRGHIEQKVTGKRIRLR